jgi:type I restriction enzyme S subunit
MTTTAWHEVLLGDVCDVHIGKTPPRARREYWGPGQAWLSIADMNQGLQLTHTRETITDEAVSACNCRLVAPGTVLLSFKLSIGKVGIACRPMYTNEAIAHLPVRNADQLDERFLVRALERADLAIQVDRAAMGATLNKEKLKAIRIPLPPKREQRRIAAILDQADELRAKRRASFALLDSLTESTFLDMFGDPIVNPKRLPVQALGSLVRPGDRINYGVVQPGAFVDDGVPLIRSGDLVGGLVRRSALKRIATDVESRYSRSRLQGDEILVSCVGTIGSIALATREDRGCNVARAVARVPLGADADRVYVAAYLRTQFVQRWLERELRTVAQPTLNIRQLKQVPVVLPTIHDQLGFARADSCIGRARRQMQRALDSIDILFSSLQRRAFRGEL